MIEIFGLTKKFNKITAIDNISFKIEKGEIFGFLGPNGAGKSTTLKILTGLIYPSGGEAFVGGYNVVRERAKLKKNIGVVFEYQNLYNRLSAYLNLDIFRKIYRLPPGRIKEVLDMVDLSSRANEPVQNYSRGMKQRLIIARSLLHHPQVLFLDEPTSGLDPNSAAHIKKMILDLSSQGITIFLNTHYLEEAEALCHKVAIINKGKIIAFDKVDILKNSFSSKELCIKFKEQGIVKDINLSLNNKDTGGKLKEILENNQVVSIHSLEPSLEEVFFKITS